MAMRKFAAFAVALVLALWPTMAAGQSVHNLERGLPVEVMDTSPTDTGKIQVQGSATNETSDTSPDRFSLQPNVQWGFAENAHLLLYSTYYIGDESVQSGSGDIYVGMLYNFLAEGQWSPGVAVQGELVTPTGVGRDGLDTALTLVSSKQITKESSEDRIHFNLRWDHNS